MAQPITRVAANGFEGAFENINSSHRLCQYSMDKRLLGSAREIPGSRRLVAT
jgi:hypothetical protein